MSQRFLLNHSVPYHDETLASWLWRLAKGNYLQSPQMIMRHLRTKVSGVKHLTMSGINGIPDIQVLQELANLGRISLADIHLHTIHRFASVFAPPELGAEVVQLTSGDTLSFLPKRPTHDFYTRQMAWCPHCLREASYVRWHWHIPLVVLCPKHQCYLADACPQCHARPAEADLICGQCGSCGLLLHSIEAISTPDDALLWQWQTTLMNWLYGGSVPDELGLPNVSVNTLVHVLQGLRYATQRAGNDWHFHHTLASLPVPNLDFVERRRLTLAERSSLYCTAFRGLLDWPHGFHAFLDAYRQRSHDMDDKGLRREFGSLYMSWLMGFWRHACFDFVSQSFNAYLVAHIPAEQVVNAKWVTYYPEILEQFDYGNAPYVAQQLGLPVVRVHRLAQDGALTAYRFGKYKGTTLYSRSEVDRLKQKWRRHLTRTQAAQQLGVSLEIIREILQSEVLQAVSPSEGTEWGSIIYVSQDNIDALLHGLRQHIRIQAEIPSDGVYIAEASQLCSCAVSLNYANLLQRIIQGKLVAYHADAAVLPLGKIWFSREDVAALPQVLKEERGWLSLTETLQHMDVKRSTLQHFFDAGLLTPVAGLGQKRFFSRDEVYALKVRMVSSREAAELLQLPLKTVLHLAHCRVLSPISGPGINRHGHYFYDRNDLLKWQKNNITLAEIRATVADPDLRKQVRQQVIPIFRGPNIYIREEVISVVNLYHQ